MEIIRDLICLYLKKVTFNIHIKCMTLLVLFLKSAANNYLIRFMDLVRKTNKYKFIN